MQNNKRFYTVKETANILNVCYHTLRHYIADGRIPTVIIGKRKFVTETTIQQLEQSAR